MEAHSSGRNDVDFVALSLGYRQKKNPLFERRTVCTYNDPV